MRNAGDRGPERRAGGMSNKTQIAGYGALLGRHALVKSASRRAVTAQQASG